MEINWWYILLVVVTLYVLWKGFIIALSYFGSGTAYRLGDIVARNDPYVCSGYYLNKHKGTIGYEYAAKTNERNNFRVLYKISKLRKKKLKTIPKNNEIIVHLRLGDVIELSNLSVDEYLETNKKFDKVAVGMNCLVQYIKPRKFYEDYILKNIKKIKEIDTVVFVAGDHQELDSLKKSKEYLEKVSEIFEHNGYKIKVRFNEYTADDDFVYCSNAKYFVPSGGRYSELISNVAKFNNGKVYDKYISGPYVE